MALIKNTRNLRSLSIDIRNIRLNYSFNNVSVPIAKSSTDTSNSSDSITIPFGIIRVYTATCRIFNDGSNKGTGATTITIKDQADFLFSLGSYANNGGIMTNAIEDTYSLTWSNGNSHTVTGIIESLDLSISFDDVSEYEFTVTIREGENPFT